MTKWGFSCEAVLLALLSSPTPQAACACGWHVSYVRPSAWRAPRSASKTRGWGPPISPIIYLIYRHRTSAQINGIIRGTPILLVQLIPLLLDTYTKVYLYILIALVFF